MTDVAIVGGGIGGLAAAIALDQRGIDASVYEAADELRPVGSGIWVSPNGIAALERLGVAESVVDAGVVFDRTVVETRDGTRLMAADLRGDWVDDPMVALHRADLHGALADRVSDDLLHLGRECVDVSRAGDRPSATFADGSTVEADVVVGADGIDSAVRSALYPDRTPEYAGYVSFRGIADRGLPAERRRTGRAVWAGDRRVGHSGIGPDRTYWWAGIAADADECDWSARRARDALRERFADFPDPMPGLIEDTDPDAILRTELRDLPALPSYHEGRVALLGDAAHAMVPNLAQGSAQALEDAVALADCLDERGRSAAALAAYEDRRKDRADRIARQSRIQNRASAVTNPLLERLRDWGFRLTPDALVRRSTASVFDPSF